MKKYWKKFLNLKIRDKILYSNLTIILLIFLVLGVSIYRFSGQLAVDSFKTYSSKLMNQLSMNLSSHINDLGDFAAAQYMNSAISEYLDYDSKKDSVKKQYSRKKYIESYAYNLMNYRTEVKMVSVEDSHGCFYTNMRELEDLAPSSEKLAELVSYDQAVEARGRLVWHAYDEKMILASRVLYDRNTMQTAGIMTLGVDKRFFEEIYAGISDNKINGLVLLDQDGSVLLSTNDESRAFAEAVIKKEKLSQESDREIYYQFQKYIYSLKKTQKDNLYIMNIVNQERLMSDTKEIFRPFLYASALAIVLAVILSGLLSSTMSKNIKLLLQKIQSFSKGDFSNRIEPDTRDEIGELSIEFNKMSDEIQCLLEDIAEEKLKNKDAEIKALQSEYDSLQAKINPHFLYNTLESINSMAKIDGEEEIARAIQLLGNYLRDTISRENRFITLGQELENVMDYAGIQQIVHGDRLQFEVNADEILLDAIVPKLILQPLVENAIVHGLEPKCGKGRIEIEIKCSNKDLCIYIRDDGVGIRPDRLENNMIVEQEKTSGHSHVGIWTVHKRLQILYGEEYGIMVESREEEGTTILVKLPIIFEGDEDV